MIDCIFTARLVTGMLVPFQLVAVSLQINGVEDIHEASLSLFTLLEPKIGKSIIHISRVKRPFVHTSYWSNLIKRHFQQ